MKFEIDLSELDLDEMSVNDAIIDAVARQLIAGSVTVRERVESAIAKTIGDEINQSIKSEVGKICSASLDTEFTEIDQWGNTRGKPQTLRSKIVECVQVQCNFKKEESYNRDRDTVLTKAIKEVVENLVKAEADKCRKIIDGMFLEGCIETAQERLREKLRLPK